MQRPKYRYSTLYEDITKSPELAKFRRYTKYWTWMLYHESSEISKQEKECNDAIATAFKFPPGRTFFTVTDLDRVCVESAPPFLKSKIRNLKGKVRRYSKDLCLAHAVTQLPDQSQLWGKQLNKYQVLFENGIFGPTGENEGIYRQVPPHEDTCSLMKREEDDPITELTVRNMSGFKMWIGKFLWKSSKRTNDDLEAGTQGTVQFTKVRTTMNVVAALYAPALFTSSMAVLSYIPSLKVRIVVLGIFGVVLTASMILFVPTLKRSEIFAITAAFYAVGGVYIGSINTIGVGG